MKSYAILSISILIVVSVLIHLKSISAKSVDLLSSEDTNSVSEADALDHGQAFKQGYIVGRKRGFADGYRKGFEDGQAGRIGDDSSKVSNERELEGRKETGAPIAGAAVAPSPVFNKSKDKVASNEAFSELVQEVNQPSKINNLESEEGKVDGSPRSSSNKAADPTKGSNKSVTTSTGSSAEVVASKTSPSGVNLRSKQVKARKTPFEPFSGNLGQLPRKTDKLDKKSVVSELTRKSDCGSPRASSVKKDLTKDVFNEGTQLAVEPLDSVVGGGLGSDLLDAGKGNLKSSDVAEFKILKSNLVKTINDLLTHQANIVDEAVAPGPSKAEILEFEQELEQLVVDLQRMLPFLQAENFRGPVLTLRYLIKKVLEPLILIDESIEPIEGKLTAFENSIPELKLILDAIESVVPNVQNEFNGIVTNPTLENGVKK